MCDTRDCFGCSHAEDLAEGARMRLYEDIERSAVFIWQRHCEAERDVCLHYFKLALLFKITLIYRRQNNLPENPNHYLPELAGVPCMPCTRFSRQDLISIGNDLHCNIDTLIRVAGPTRENCKRKLKTKLVDDLWDLFHDYGHEDVRSYT